MTPINDSSDSSIDDSGWLFEGRFSKVDVVDAPNRRIIAGYANVAGVVDNQNEKVTINALSRAWGRWKAKPEYCMIMLMHTSTPVAKVLFDPVKDGEGNTHQSGVDERGLYLVGEWRDDTVLANRSWKDVESGDLRGFSIGGIRLSKRRECVGDRCFNVLEDLEIYETSAVPKPANEWSVFGMLKSDLMELSKISNLFKESVIAEDMVKISKTRGCECGKYHIVLGKGLEGLQDVFTTSQTRVVEKEVDGVEYIPLFNLALLRPFSIDETVMTAESDSGGFESSLKKDEPKSEGDIMTGEVNEKQVDNISTENTQTEEVVQPEPVVEQVQEAVEPAIDVKAIMEEMVKLREEITQLKAEKEKTIEPVLVVETPIVPEKGSEGSVRSDPSDKPVVEAPKVIEPKPETRGQVIPSVNRNKEFDLLDVHNLSWYEINESAPE